MHLNLAASPRRASEHLPDAAEIAAIAAMRRADLRNLWITETYHRLEVALAPHLGGIDLGWCAFGAWASKTAGRFIRGELVPELVLHWVAGAPAPLAGWLDRIDRRVRERVAEGNLLVFAELAPLFRGLVDVLALPLAERDAAARRLVDALRVGPTAEGGLSALRRALLAYVEAAALTRRKARSERILLANALVGFHEQARLQPAIAGAIAAPFEVLVGGEGIRAALGAPLARRLRALLTRHFMTLALPGRDLALGADVPALTGGAMFPHDLMALDSAELRALLRVLDRTPDTTDGSAAADWSDLGDRMNYIVDLFRSRQQDLRLHQPPFTRAQLVALRAGALPSGPL